MIKKYTYITFIIFFLTSCGFSPIYLKNNNIQFSIEQANYTGDRELNNFLKTNLNQYKNEKHDNKIFIEVDTKYEKVKLIENYKKILIAINPVIPHFSSECLEMIKVKEKIL